MAAAHPHQVAAVVVAGQLLAVVEVRPVAAENLEAAGLLVAEEKVEAVRLLVGEKAVRRVVVDAAVARASCLVPTIRSIPTPIRGSSCRDSRKAPPQTRQ